MSKAEKSDRPERNQDLRCQSGRQPKIQSSAMEETLQRIMEQNQQRLQISDLHFDKFPYASNLCLLEDKIQDRGLYLFTISYGSNAVDQRSGVG